MTGAPARPAPEAAPAEAETGPRLGIGKVAEAAGVSERTLRYYEEVGLLTPSGHSPGGCRRYTEAEVERVSRIRELQEVMGYSLEEVHAVLAARDRLDAIREAWRAGGEGPAGQLRLLEEALATLQSSRRRTRVKVERLAGILERLDATIARYEAVAEDLRQSEAGARGEAAGEEPARV